MLKQGVLPPISALYKRKSMDNDWLQVDIKTTSEGAELLGCVLHDLGYPAIQIDDPADIGALYDGKYGVWDHISDELMKHRPQEVTVTVYIESGQPQSEGLDAIRQVLSRQKGQDSNGGLGSLEYSISNIKDEKWSVAWREHFKPIAIGEKLIILPSWDAEKQTQVDKQTQAYEQAPDDRKTLLIEPGRAFGTGIDETTRLCLEVLESSDLCGCSVLDIGCGSGILAIAAVLMGAKSAIGTDNSQVAVNSAKENAMLNGVSGFIRFICGNLADNVTDSFDIVCVNIAADIILTFIPEASGLLKPDALLILSGIIANFEQDVIETLISNGFRVRQRMELNGWVCVVSQL